MKRAWLIAATALIFVGCITAVCALAMQDWDFSRLSTVNYETNTHPVTEDFHNISINTDTAHYDAIAAVANQHPNIEQIDLEPYHPMGIGKTAALGKTAAYTNGEFLAPDLAEQTKAYLVRRVNIPVRISGK